MNIKIVFNKGDNVIYEGVKAIGEFQCYYTKLDFYTVDFVESIQLYKEFKKDDIKHIIVCSA